MSKDYINIFVSRGEARFLTQFLVTQDTGVRIFRGDLRRVKHSDVLIIPAGPSIHPSLIGVSNWKNLSVAHSSTEIIGSMNIQADIVDTSAYSEAIKHNIHIIGFGERGATFVGAMNGADIVTYMDGHYNVDHNVFFGRGPSSSKEGRREINSYRSLHNKTVYPYRLPKDKYELILYSISRSSKFVLNYSESYSRNDQDVWREPEIVRFGNQMCVIPEPELIKYSKIIPEMRRVITKFIKTKY
jgi:hypothetical protein